MNKRQLIDEIRIVNPTAETAFLARFGEGDLQEYFQHLVGSRKPRLTSHSGRYDKYFIPCQPVTVARIERPLPVQEAPVAEPAPLAHDEPAAEAEVPATIAATPAEPEPVAAVEEPIAAVEETAAPAEIDAPVAQEELPQPAAATQPVTINLTDDLPWPGAQPQVAVQESAKEAAIEDEPAQLATYIPTYQAPAEEDEEVAEAAKVAEAVQTAEVETPAAVKPEPMVCEEPVAHEEPVMQDEPAVQEEVVEPEVSLFDEDDKLDEDAETVSVGVADTDHQANKDNSDSWLF